MQQNGGQIQGPSGPPGLTVPHNLIGQVIGAGGRNIKPIERMSKTKIQIDSKAQGAMKPVTIAGDSAESIAYARELVQALINRGKIKIFIEKST